MHTEPATLIEEGQRIRGLVAGEREHTFIDGKEDDFGIRGRLSGSIVHVGVDLHFFSGFRRGPAWLNRHGQLIVRPGHFHFAIANPVFGRLNLARAVIRAPQQHHRNENIRRIRLQQRHLDRRCIPA